MTDAVQPNANSTAPFVPSTVRAAPQKVLSVLFAQGWSNQKIKEYLETLGHRVSVRAIQGLRDSPLMRIAVRGAETDLSERLLSRASDVRQRLQAEALPSITVLSEIRDGLHDADAGHMRGAANDLLGYTVPKKTQTESTNTLVFSIDPKTIKAMKNVMIEAGHTIPALPTGEIPGSFIEAEVESETVGIEEVSDDSVAQKAGNSSYSEIDKSVPTEGSAGTPPAGAKPLVVSPLHFNSEREYDPDDG